jgi:hypothetical protein
MRYRASWTCLTALFGFFWGLGICGIYGLPVYAHQGHPESLPKKPVPCVGKAMPPFVVKDVEGKSVGLVALRPRPVVLFFACGCDACLEVAREWARLQRTQSLPARAITLVVFWGTAPEARQLSLRAGLDPAQTSLIADESGALSGRYEADPCPRLVVLDGKGVVRYINTGKDDQPQVGATSVIVSRASAALQSCREQPPATLRKSQ